MNLQHIAFPGSRFVWPVVLLATVVFGLFLGPTINQDSLFGLFVARDFHAGAPWNHLFFPDPAELAQTRSAFVAWWAPAQWLIPDQLHQAGLPLGWALTVTSVVALFGGLVGWARLYRALGYAERTVAGSLIVLVLSVHFWRRLAEYHGGEVLLFAGLPWIVLGALRAGDGVRALWLLPPLFLLGGFVKLSFSISALAIVAFLWAKDHLSRPFTRGSARAAAVLGASFLVFYALFRATYLSRGITPDACEGARRWVEPLFMPGGPISFLIAGQQLSGRFIGELSSPAELLWGVIAGALGLALIVFGARHAPNPTARAAVITFCGINISAMAFLTWRGDRVWFIDRMFLPAGLVLLPALVHVVVDHGSSIARWVIIAVLAGGSVYSVAHATQYVRWMRRSTAPSPQHVRHLGLDEDGMKNWRALSSPAPADATVFFIDPASASLALEWPNWRAYVPEYAAICGMIDGGPRLLRGRPSALRIVAFDHSPAEYRADHARARFADVPVSTWQRTTIDRVVMWQSLAPQAVAGAAAANK